MIAGRRISRVRSLMATALRDARSLSAGTPPTPAQLQMRLAAVSLPQSLLAYRPQLRLALHCTMACELQRTLRFKQSERIALNATPVRLANPNRPADHAVTVVALGASHTE